MKRIPRTPVEFDYDLWTTEDGKCMVRVKCTGETTEIEREVMKALRREEKRLRRFYAMGREANGKDSEEKQPFTVLTLDTIPDHEIKSSAWQIDPKNYAEDAVTNLLIRDFSLSLSSLHLSIFENCVMNQMTVREYAGKFGISKSYVSKLKKVVKEKLKNFLDF